MEIILAAAAIAVGIAGTDLIAPPARRGGAGARGIFPFGFAGQPIRAAGFVRDAGMFLAHARIQPGDISTRIFPIETHRGPFGRLHILGWIGEAFSRRMPFHVGDLVAGLRLITRLLQEDLELLAGHIVFAQGEGADADNVLRALRIETSRLAFGTSHHETSGGNADHHRAMRAFGETAIIARFSMRRRRQRKAHGEQNEKKTEKTVHAASALSLPAASMSRATASATLIPSTPAERIPPAKPAPSPAGNNPRVFRL